MKPHLTLPPFSAALLFVFAGMQGHAQPQTTPVATARHAHTRRSVYDHNPLIVYYANAYADHYGVQRELVHAIITTESGWYPLATSNVYKDGHVEHAQGLMQLMPETGREYGVTQPYSVSDNIGGGVCYLAHLLREFHGEMRLAVAAYYSGNKWVGLKQLNYSNPDVTRYVKTVRANYVREIIMHHPQQER